MDCIPMVPGELGGLGDPLPPSPPVIVMAIFGRVRTDVVCVYDEECIFMSVVCILTIWIYMAVNTSTIFTGIFSYISMADLIK